jgi:hypothetical protein
MSCRHLYIVGLIVVISVYFEQPPSRASVFVLSVTIELNRILCTLAVRPIPQLSRADVTALRVIYNPEKYFFFFHFFASHGLQIPQPVP